MLNDIKKSACQRIFLNFFIAFYVIHCYIEQDFLYFINFFVFLFMEIRLDHSFSESFRKEIAGGGLKVVIAGLLESKSTKVPLKKLYLARECQKKKSFRTQVEQVFNALCAEQPKNRVAFKALKNELIKE